MRNNWKELELDELENINGGDDWTLIKWPNINDPTDRTRYVFKNDATGALHICHDYYEAYKFTCEQASIGNGVATRGKSWIWYRLLKEQNLV